MADPALHGNGTRCAACAGAGRIWRPDAVPGRRWVRCPARCHFGRVPRPVAEIVAREIAR